VKHNAVKWSTKLITSLNSKCYRPSGILIHLKNSYVPRIRRCPGRREPVSKGPCTSMLLKLRVGANKQGYYGMCGIATGYGLDDQGGREFESRQGQNFSLLHIVQTGSGVHPTSYKMSTGGFFPGGKVAGA
jgi:hypothetical protein